MIDIHLNTLTKFSSKTID